MLRRLFVLTLFCVAVGAFTSPAFGARPVGFSHTVQSRHFLVHYVSDPADTAYTTERQASMLATVGDRAYDAETGWGFPAPANDGDGLVDIYVEDLSALPGLLAYAQAESAVAPSTGYIVFGAGGLDAPDEGATVAHELFHLVQYDSWSSAATQDGWLFEGSAEWAAAKVYGFPGNLASTSGPGDVSLDCRDNIPAFQMCDPHMYIEGGYSRWPFFQALASRYGVTFLQSVLANGASGMSAIQALAAAIGAKGGSLADTYSDWSVMQMAGGYGIPTLDTLAPTTFATISTGATTGALSTVKLPVDHLATRYVKFTRGDNAGDHPCFAATLTINVTFPGVVTTRPYFYWNAKGSTPVALAVSGNTATTKLPWDTCLWAANAGYLSLPNLTTNVDSVDFTVSGTLDVDPNTPASAGTAPTQVPVYGGQTQVSNADLAPEISVFGPLLLKVSTTSPTLRLIVEASGEGQVHTTLGGTDLGTSALRPGNNDLRLTLPKSLLNVLKRRLASGTNVLTLTPVSSSGSATGTAVTRTVSVTQPKPKKTKKK